VYLSYIRIFFTYILALLSGVVQCGRRLTDLNTLAALAAAEQRRQQLHSTREDRRARARRGPASSTWHSTWSNSLSLAMPLSRHTKQQPSQRWWL